MDRILFVFSDCFCDFLHISEIILENILASVFLSIFVIIILFWSTCRSSSFSLLSPLLWLSLQATINSTALLLSTVPHPVVADTAILEAMTAAITSMMLFLPELLNSSNKTADLQAVDILLNLNTRPHPLRMVPLLLHTEHQPEVQAVESFLDDLKLLNVLPNSTWRPVHPEDTHKEVILREVITKCYSEWNKTLV